MKHLIITAVTNTYIILRIQTCDPTYEVLWLMTTLWILPNFPKYSWRLRISASQSRGESPTTKTRFFCTTLHHKQPTI